MLFRAVAWSFLSCWCSGPGQTAGLIEQFKCEIEMIEKLATAYKVVSQAICPVLTVRG